MGDITASGTATNNFTNFKIQSIPLNPALTFFPWLDGVAQNYQEYEWNGLVFEYKSLYSEAVSVTAGASGAMGSVIMATNYNAAAPNYANKQQLLEAEYSTDCKPSCSFFHPIECKPSLTPVSRLYTRTGAVPANQDQRLYDFANFQIASMGCQAASAVLGELWCTYEVKLFKPIQVFASGGSILTDHWKLSACTTSNELGTVVPGTSPVLGAGSTLNGVIANGGTYTFPSFVQQGTFMFILSYDGTGGATATLPTLGASPGVNILQVWNADAANFGNGPQTLLAGTIDQLIAWVINIGPSFPTGTQAVLTVSDITLPGAPVSGDLWVTQIANITS